MQWKWSIATLSSKVPIKQGVMSIPIFETRAAQEHDYSRIACSWLRTSKNQTTKYVSDTAKATKRRDEIMNSKKEKNKQVEEQVK